MNKPHRGYEFAGVTNKPKFALFVTPAYSSLFCRPWMTNNPNSTVYRLNSSRERRVTFRSESPEVNIRNEQVDNYAVPGYSRELVFTAKQLETLDYQIKIYAQVECKVTIHAMHILFILDFKLGVRSCM